MVKVYIFFYLGVLTFPQTGNFSGRTVLATLSNAVRSIYKDSQCSIETGGRIAHPQIARYRQPGGYTGTLDRAAVER
jgi:hypothetical protein